MRGTLVVGIGVMSALAQPNPNRPAATGAAVENSNLEPRTSNNSDFGFRISDFSKEVVGAYNSFGFKLLDHLRQTLPERTVFLSPDL